MQAKCLETGETVAIKKVLQDKRYKNRELQTMRLLDHPNVVSLKHCFFSTTEKDELYLNLVLEYVPETVHRVIKHYNKMNQRMPLIYVKLYFYQVFGKTTFFIFMCIGQSRFVLSQWWFFLGISFCSPLTFSFLLSFLPMQICRSLSYIHNSIGVCHRDIKPQNLLVSFDCILMYNLFFFTIPQPQIFT